MIDVTSGYDQNDCEMCGTAIGSHRKYCSNACRQAHYRKEHNASVTARYGGRADTSTEHPQLADLENIPICAIPACDNLVAAGKRNRRWLMYCSDACKQKAKRLKQSGRDGLDKRTRSLRQSDSPTLLYFRKGKGVVHLAVSHGVALCGRSVEDSVQLDDPGKAKVCQRCTKTRDEQNLQNAWSKVLDDQSPEPEQKTLKVELYLRVENNNKFVRGRKRSIEWIEGYILDAYNMKKKYKDRCVYILTIPYTSDQDLDDTIYEILREAWSAADHRNCFIEADVRALDGSERYW